MTLRRPTISAVLSMLALGVHSTPAQEILAPDTDAAAVLRSAIARGAHGTVEATEAEAAVRLFVNGQPVPADARVHLVEPGSSVELTAEIAAPARPAAEPRMETGGVYRQSTITEGTWHAEPDDYLLTGTGGGVVWRPGTARGRASTVTASIARLVVERPPSLAASPEAPVRATLLHGRADVLLLAGVAFDRNGDGLLEGQNIGIYPNERDPRAPNTIKDNVQHYRPPTTFYRVEERSAAALVTGRFTLGDLAPVVFPEDAARPSRFAAVSPRLIRFLGAFEKNAAAAKLDPARLRIIRGFVSPTDRLRLERQGIRLAEYTRFQYGDAVALVYDTTSNGTGPAVMGDVNGDGQTTIADVDALAAIAKATMEELGTFGGIGTIAKFEGPGASKGTPYLHVDLRGWLTPFREE